MRLLEMRGEKTVFVIREHRFALFCWRRALEQGLISAGAFLVHIDAHTDFTFDPSHHPGATRFLTMSSGEAFEYVRGLRPDNSEFIVNAMYSGIVQDGLCVYYRSCNDYGTLSEDEREFEGHHFLMCRRENLGSLNFTLVEKGWSLPSSFILDIDLDYFCYRNEQVYPRHADDVKHQMEVLKALWERAAIVTIALEPECCGGDEHCLEILEYLDNYLCHGLFENGRKVLES